MNSDDLTTLQRILSEGKKEFLGKGYKDASLRNIVKRAGVTTGAFYGYYPDKAALFDELVSPAAKELRALYVNSLESFDRLPEERKISEMHTYTEEHLTRLVEYMYDHFDAFKLIVCCADGTEYEDYIDLLVEMEEAATSRFIQLLRKNGYSVNNINPNLCHMLSSAYFNGIFETVAHDMPREEAALYIATMTEFFNAGWDKIFGLL